jgi:hypothetical protein
MRATHKRSEAVWMTNTRHSAINSRSSQICIDEDGDLKSLAAMDTRLAPIVKNVWGKPLPFPVLLDPTFKTLERYGLPGLGTVILVDPDGKLVEGDETTLAEKLAGDNTGSNKK